jgi:hypothetical protein
MPWSPADLVACDAAILQAMLGQSVSFADRAWSSQDLGKLLSLRSTIAAAVNAGDTHYATRFAAHSKGV